MNNFLIIFLILISTSISLSQKKYIVSIDGSGDFISIAQLNSANLNIGDTVAFKAREKFADASLLCKKGVTYTSFGTGQAIIGDSTSKFTSDATIIINKENVTLKNLKIYGYYNTTNVIEFSKNGLTVEDCQIIGGYTSHEKWSSGLYQTSITCSSISIQKNIIHGFGKAAIVFSRPYNWDIGHNEMFDLWRMNATMDLGAQAIARVVFGDGNAPEDVWDCAYTVNIHHNNIHHFEMAAFMGYSRIIYEYNEIHDNLDERIYRGGVKHGNVGKLYDNLAISNDAASYGSLGLIFRYNYIHNLIRRGEADKTYGLPNIEDYRSGTYTGTITSNTLGRSVYLFAVANNANNYGDHYGDGVGEAPDLIISGLGYGNYWVHNNIFYNCSNRLIGRSFNYKNEKKNNLPSYFINNTVINCGYGYAAKEGLFYVMTGSGSPYFWPGSGHNMINNIVNYTYPKSLFIAEWQDSGYVRNNIYTSHTSETVHLKQWSRGNKTSISSEQYGVDQSTIWNDTSSNIFVSNLGTAGCYIPDIRIKISGSAYNAGIAYSLLGDSFTASGLYWSQTHSLGQDPTGRSFAYDILGNFRTTNDIGAVGAVNGSSRSPNNGLKVILEGSYSNGNLKTDLVKAQLLPSKQPYNVHPWNITGDISLTNGSENYVDWVLVQIREDLTNTKYWKVGILNNDGLVLNPDGTSFSFSGLATGEYYLIIKHRNHLSIMSAQKVFIEKGKPVDYDFTDSQNKAYGGNSMADLGDGKFGMIAGDGNADGVVNVLDYSTVANNILSRGYAQGDMDMNGVMNVLDYSFISRNILKNSHLP